jgi:hypothetical protein
MTREKKTYNNVLQPPLWEDVCLFWNYNNQDLDLESSYILSNNVNLMTKTISICMIVCLRSVLYPFLMLDLLCGQQIKTDL